MTFGDWDIVTECLNFFAPPTTLPQERWENLLKDTLLQENKIESGSSNSVKPMLLCDKFLFNLDLFSGDIKKTLKLNPKL